jgi:hypothetical protein
MVNLINESKIFISNNLERILSVTYIFLFIAFFMYVFKIKFPKEEEKETKRVVIMETMTNELNNDPLIKKIRSENKFNDRSKDLFCDSSDIEGKCENLGKTGKKGCTSIDCCVWVTNKNGGKCVEGGKDGPLMKKDEKLINFDEYYYLNESAKKVF